MQSLAAVRSRAESGTEVYYFAALCAFIGTGTNSFISLPVVGSLSRTMPSKPAEATSLPSGRKATA